MFTRKHQRMWWCYTQICSKHLLHVAWDTLGNKSHLETLSLNSLPHSLFWFFKCQVIATSLTVHSLWKSLHVCDSSFPIICTDVWSPGKLYSQGNERRAGSQSLQGMWWGPQEVISPTHPICWSLLLLYHRFQGQIWLVVMCRSPGAWKRFQKCLPNCRAFASRNKGFGGHGEKGQRD